jgi:hypothetical protein
VGISGFTVYTSDVTNNRIIVTGTPVSLSSGNTVSFQLGNGTSNGFTNPTTVNGGLNPVGTFYARIYTYATAAAAQGHNTGTPTGFVDAGGVALSTAAIINITAKVQETLSFCVYKTTCGDDPSFTIGHTVGTATIIDANTIDTSTTNFSIATNANNGVIVRMKGDTLKFGSNDIDPAGSSQLFAINTEAFGLRMSTLGTGMTATSPYNATAGRYSLIVTGGGTDDVTSTFGGNIASLAGPSAGTISTITFAAAASNTTTAGTYTAAEQLIATGTF